ncbi:MraY family glycosyltransferase [Paradesertivirga mongoliensis]|uniref:MraY family glycosyltransferase n=1 Tax=Paradesertivirga mongoliensis TaxID=2100740 RepID=A0ABW4ZSE0_9SPHI|nr:MraY family glycosyltransferase [Pedobacter mongoliensis]
MLKYITLPEPFFYIVIFLIAVVLVLIAIPSIIHVANHRALFDDIDTERKDHKFGISRLGGVAIFCSFMISSLFIPNAGAFREFHFLLASCLILFAVGLKDDLWGVNPSTKFGMQFIVASIMVLLADVRVTSLYGVFSIYDIPYFVSVSFTILLIMFVINAFNLIDGIDGLAGVTGLVVNISLGIMFAEMGETILASMAFIIAGACIGFLRYNITPAQIFMGDTGSLLLGFISIVLCVQFIELNKVSGTNIVFYSSAPSIAVAILIGPIFDAIRVFTLRTIKTGSPFVADRNHVHHRMLHMGFSHLQTTLILMGFHIVMIYVALSLRFIGNFSLIGILFLICLFFNLLLTFMIRSKTRKSYRIVNFLW